MCDGEPQYTITYCGKVASASRYLPRRLHQLKSSVIQIQWHSSSVDARRRHSQDRSNLAICQSLKFPAATICHLTLRQFTSRPQNTCRQSINKTLLVTKNTARKPGMGSGCALSVVGSQRPVTAATTVTYWKIGSYLFPLIKCLLCVDIYQMHSLDTRKFLDNRPVHSFFVFQTKLISYLFL